MDFKYGKEIIKLDCSPGKVLLPREGEASAVEEADIIKAALQNPVGSRPLREIAPGKGKVVVLISDITRPCPSYKLLPHLMAELKAAGVANDAITIVCGLGSHRQQTEAERCCLAGEEICRSYRVVDSDVNDYVAVGVSSRGTPFEVFRPVAEADLIICTGNIDYHYFAGYSGGCKAVVPGVCTRQTIQHNHKMMLEADACTGKADGNPVRMDMEEIRRFLPVDFMLNVVLNPKKEIIAAYAGDPVRAHRRGCAFLDSLFKVEIKEAADIVIASAGGYPKDINIYQAQKALDNGSVAVKDGGILILVANCSEGYGEATFESWLKEADSPDYLLAKIRAEFKLGGHKAAAIAGVVKRIKVFIVTELDEAVTDTLFMRRFDSLEQAYREALREKGDKASVIAIPYAGATLPCLSKHEEA